MDRTRATRQKTLKSAIRCAGVGLHSGHTVTMTLQPAAIDSGISFRRIDANVAIAATWRNLVPSCLCSTLASNGVSVGTVEHLMAAFAGLEIDNAVVEIDGAEVPAMDGSAAPFVALIERAGIVEQDAPRRAIEILKQVRVAGDGAEASLEPADGFSLSFVIDFASGTVGRQRLAVAPDPENFKHGIARARTFGFFDEVEQHARRRLGPRRLARQRRRDRRRRRDEQGRPALPRRVRAPQGCSTRWAISTSPAGRSSAASPGIARVTR